MLAKASTANSVPNTYLMRATRDDLALTEPWACSFFVGLGGKAQKDRSLDKKRGARLRTLLLCTNDQPELRLDIDVPLLLKIGNTFHGDRMFGRYKARHEFFKWRAEQFHRHLAHFG